jgi:hypothetical protein
LISTKVVILIPLAPWEEAEVADDETAEEGVDGESNSAVKELAEESTAEAAEAFVEQPLRLLGMRLKKQSQLTMTLNKY